MSGLNREQRKARGEHAARLLNDELLREAFETVDAECVAAWRESKTPEEREAAWALAHALQRVQQRLRSIMDDGQYAQVGIERRQE